MEGFLNLQNFDTLWLKKKTVYQFNCTWGGGGGGGYFLFLSFILCICHTNSQTLQSLLKTIPVLRNVTRKPIRS